jgi:hypothetical protein
MPAKKARFPLDDPRRRPRLAPATEGASPAPTQIVRHRTVDIRIVAKDPGFVDAKGKPVLATLQVPAHRLLPGPRDHRLYVVDFDPTTSTATAPTRRLGAGWSFVDPFATKRWRDLADDPQFHALNAYAVAASVLARFELSLGRRIPWAFDGHHLYLVPHVTESPNAAYMPEARSVILGSFTVEHERRYLCLSHDVIAHEVTHAILDGLRPRYVEPGLADQPAFHEGLADITALLSVFALPDVVETAVRRRLQSEQRRPSTRQAPRVANGTVEPFRVYGSPEFVDLDTFSSENLKGNALFELAAQLGSALNDGGGPLRRSFADVPVGTEWKAEPEFQASHRRGEVLVAAVCSAVATLWAARLADIARNGEVPLRRACEEGALIGGHILGMCIRSLDYLPPIEFEFGDFIDAIESADELVVPDDRRNYRGVLRAAFDAYGIKAPPTTTLSYNTIRPWNYHRVNALALRSSADEVYRFLWNNADNFQIDLNLHLHVERVVNVRRTGPDGLVVEEVIADYVQSLRSRFADLPAAWRRGVALDPDTEVQCWGGGVVTFDQFGRPRHHVSKALTYPHDGSRRQGESRANINRRQRERLRRLVDEEIFDTKGRIGFSYGFGKNTLFRSLHDEAPSREAW